MTGRGDDAATRWTALAAASLLWACAATPPPAAPARGDVTGALGSYAAGPEETLLDVARAHDLGYVELLAANPGVDPWLPGEGTEVVLPTAHVLPEVPREGIVINLAEQRLYQFDSGVEARSFPIGVSRDGWRTPLGKTRVVRKRLNPTWYPGPTARADDPELGEAVVPGPDNPLGSHALYLGWPAYLVHGTNEPDGIGRRVSRGCIRLYPEDIARLYEATPIGTTVRVINDPVKLGWSGGELYLEAHPTLQHADQIEATGRFEPEPPASEILARIAEYAGPVAERLDWNTAALALQERRGLPVRITRPERPDGFWTWIADRLR